MAFEFATAARIVFGEGKRAEIAPAARAFGERFLLVTGSTPQRADWLASDLERRGLSGDRFPIHGEPTTGEVACGADLARRSGVQVVIALGGGSPIDAAKAIAAMAANPGELHDYLEVIGRAQPIERPSLPWIAVPTTAGAGAEVTRNAVITSVEHRFKVSIRSPLLVPKLAVVDPELTYDLPQHLTASTGMDALTQLIEPYVSCRANPLTDALCEKGIPLAARSLERAWANGRDAAARGEMSLASLLGGLCLANAGLGAVHGFAAPIGGMFGAPHGAVCAALLPAAFQVNCEAIQARGSQDLRERFTAVAQMLTGQASATVAQGVAFLERLRRTLGIPRLREHGVTGGDLPDICAKARAASSMKANPIELTDEELMGILRQAW